MSKPKVVIFTAAPEERRELEQALENAEFERFEALVVETGAGKINGALGAAAALAPLAGGPGRPLLVLGAGLAFALSFKVAAGQTLVSESVIIGDWILESDYARTYGPYGRPVYRAPSPPWAEEMAVKSRSPLAAELAAKLRAKGFLQARLWCGDARPTGGSGRLERGRLFGCPAGDQESGAWALAAEKFGLPWLNLKTLADGLDEKTSAPAAGEGDPLESLALKVVVALSTLDALPRSPGCQGCAGGCGF